MTATLTVKDLVIGYGDRVVADVGSFEAAPDRVTLVVGPNGAGKSTLLKTLAGLLPPLGGAIDPRLPSGPGGAVLVHSTPYLFSGTVRRNMLLSAGGSEQTARAALDALGVGGLRPAAVSTLSAGQRQRVALARALAADPAVLLVDEPEGELDADAIARWRGVVLQAIERRRPTIVLAAHRPVALDGIAVLEIRVGEGSLVLGFSPAVRPPQR